MSVINKISRGLETASDILTEAAFGDIRNVIGGRTYSVGNVGKCAIGLANKDYLFMAEHLSRNIGNTEYTYDGYGTPIGILANPFYNTIVREPLYMDDEFKNGTPNYLEYIRTVYGDTIGLDNINNGDHFLYNDESMTPGVINTDIIGEYMVTGSEFGYGASYINPNGFDTDTRLGVDGSFFAINTFRNSIVENDKRKAYLFGITEGVSNGFGISSNNIANTDLLTIEKRISEDTGRMEDLSSSLVNIESPVGNNKSYGNVYNLGSYQNFYDSLSEKSKQFYNDNISLNKFYPKINQNQNPNGTKGQTDEFSEYRGKTYFGRVGVNVGHADASKTGLDVTAIDNLQIRYIFTSEDEKHSNISDTKNGGLYTYAENEDGSTNDYFFQSFSPGTRFGRYTSYANNLTYEDILKKTNDAFRKGKYDTLIARFHTPVSAISTTDTTQTAINTEYGMSHGRNLLKKNPKDSDGEGYDNPYCRVWTYHHQYSTLQDTIRGGDNFGQTNLMANGFDKFTAKHDGFDDGRTRLLNHGVLNKHNHLVNIAPISSPKEHEVNIKNCMFSIENLAWKDAFSTDNLTKETFQAGGLSAEQKGPLGGRIMWFPPYDLKFSEDVSVQWNENAFIGRGENIYTYTNTSRGGSLDFKILIDHPSVLNYWAGKNVEYTNGNETDDAEQELLRFFAGCDMLTPKVSPVKEPIPVIDNEVIDSPDTDKIEFFVFYPNNYSGVDDDPIYAINYLVNGVGTWKELRNGSVIDFDGPFANYNNGFGGYEMRPGFPISIVTNQTKGVNKISTVYCGRSTTPHEIVVQEGPTNTTWWKCRYYYRCDKAYIGQILKKESYIDKDSQGFNSSYGQSTVASTFGISDTEKLYSLADVFAAFNKDKLSVIHGLYDEAKYQSFLSAIESHEISSVKCTGYADPHGYNKSNAKLQINRAETIKKWLRNMSGAFANVPDENFECTMGGVEGVSPESASYAGNKIYRCARVEIMLRAAADNGASNSVQENFVNDIMVDGQKTHYDEALPMNVLNSPGKTSRMNYQDRVPAFNDMKENDYFSDDYLKQRSRTIQLTRLSDNINRLSMNLKSAYYNGNVNVNTVADSIADFTEHYNKFTYDENGFISKVGGGNGLANYSVSKTHDNSKLGYGVEGNSIDEATEQKTNEERNAQNGTTNASTENVRYDNEADFFRLLEKNEPFLHHKLREKIRYFDPAFHSISPEGFNARLTFLHQCTRQGPTIGQSDNNTENKNANNLSFGRPPVCVLRVGDFYYTRVIIESMNINYDPLVWDLNPEGIGVMPMIANVNLRFKFIGGSSLTGPITRLQNALSFNAYANTEVYDNRAELIEYDDNGKISKFKPYEPKIN